MTFTDFLSTLKAGADERGDFLRLASRDVHLPEVRTWAEFYSYIEAQHSQQIAEAGAALWKRYQMAESKSYTG